MRTQRACRFALHFTGQRDSRIFIATVCIIYSNKILLYRFIHSLLEKEYSDFCFPADMAAAEDHVIDLAIQTSVVCTVHAVAIDLETLKLQSLTVMTQKRGCFL